jgi:hypothetical protein
VSCDLGKLYNKDALIEFLLDRSAFGDGEVICGHIRSLKVCKLLFFVVGSVVGANYSLVGRQDTQIYAEFYTKV